MLNVPSLVSKTIQFLIAFIKYFACCNQKLDGGKAWEQGYNVPYWANSPNIWLAKKCATEMLQNLHAVCLVP